MPKTLIPFSTDDVSALAKSLRAQLTSRATPPSHVEMLNMLARATGHRNFQHFRSQAGRSPVREQPAPPEPALVLRALRYFDERGRLMSWPARTSLQNLCLWVVWSKIPPQRTFDEREISALLGTVHLFGDHAILRRTMCQLGLMTRTADGRDYRRVEQPPTPEGAALIRHLRERATVDA